MYRHSNFVSFRHSLYLSAPLAQGDVLSCRYATTSICFESRFTVSLQREMEEGAKSLDHSTRRWKPMEAMAASAKEMCPELTLQEDDGSVNENSEWPWGAAFSEKEKSSELTLPEAEDLPKVKHLLMNEKIFIEKLLPPLEKPSSTATFDFIAQYREVIDVGQRKPNYCGAKVPLKNVTINTERLSEKLKAIDYEDLQFVDYLRFGWPLGDQEDPAYTWPMQKDQRNKLSVYQNYDFVDKFIDKQVLANRIAGPFGLDHSPFGDVLPHMVPMKTTVSAGKKRLILETFALNKHTPTSVFPDGAPAYGRPHIFQFAKEVAQKGPAGAWMWKRDLSSYYLQIPIDPKDYPKLR